MQKRRLHTKKELQEYRRELRRTLTPAEAFLWRQLKGRKFKGRRFTRQHSIGHYIVDFYCASEKLIIELDGEVHFNEKAAAYDEKRTQYLNSLGYTVVRFENRMVFDFLPSVFMEIEANFKA
ncbi:endonuclease domain-containing protein [Constantimarinum furrinae]|uniref:Cytosine methyltransferase n=1 Tax=Constantimarinum furrinae TaxID=2562285 RepID=A0A7G8PQV5_9FLAO|nr:endonuclease domain-containing protein [Constantimarinum furrinae]QNJ96721.1 cytosine methyltransferase [Constantimarinum furrinae]